MGITLNKSRYAFSRMYIRYGGYLYDNANASASWVGVGTGTSRLA